MSVAARAIGSVFPLAVPEAPGGESLWAAWTSGHRNVAAYGSARAALAALLAFRGTERLWLPAYACASVAEAAVSCALCWYGVDATLAPELEELETALRPGDAVLAIDYFGRCSAAHFAALAARRPDVLWVQDRVQAPGARGPSWGEVALYSPRKLLGVPDGGLLVSDSPLPQPVGPVVARSDAAQRARAADPEGREPARWFPLFQMQEAGFAVDGAPMTDATQRVLEGVAAAPLLARRRENAAWLAAALGDVALWPAWPPKRVPLAFPVRVDGRDALAARLAAKGIYCARHWAHLPSDEAQFPVAHRLAREMLSLPCDQRYDIEDMQRIAAVIRGG